jgi:hypothetical protein
MAKKRRHPGGRPRLATRSRRPTTRTGRQPIDHGTPELQRVKGILTLGRVDLPTDILAMLYSRGLVTQEAYTAGRVFSALVHITRACWGISDNGVAHLWRMVQLGEMAEQPGPIIATGHDAGGTYVEYARRRLEEMRSSLQRDNPGGAILQAVNTVCVDNLWEGWVKRILTKLVLAEPVHSRGQQSQFVDDLIAGLPPIVKLRQVAQQLLRGLARQRALAFRASGARASAAMAVRIGHRGQP